MKYTELGGVVVTWNRIKALPDNTPSWQITISDTSAGIPDKLYARLTAADYQNASVADGHGEGIGLFIV